ncbi:MAG TPA: hypothetical protein VN238_08775 [Solirubrobacteraceae bacterium]|nr:hypothetical protein [Solirubrobacteraceae bacterium]
MPDERPPRTTPEALDALRDRLRATQEAAQKLAEDAASDRPPPMGWDVPRSADKAGEELDALVAMIGSLRDLLPPELRAQLADVVRAILEFVRVALDWWIGRMGESEGAGNGPDDVQDIPIA